MSVARRFIATSEAPASVLSLKDFKRFETRHRRVFSSARQRWGLSGVPACRHFAENPGDFGLQIRFLSLLRR